MAVTNRCRTSTGFDEARGKATPVEGGGSMKAEGLVFLAVQGRLLSHRAGSRIPLGCGRQPQTQVPVAAVTHPPRCRQINRPKHLTWPAQGFDLGALELTPHRTPGLESQLIRLLSEQGLRFNGVMSPTVQPCSTMAQHLGTQVLVSLQRLVRLDGLARFGFGSRASQCTDRRARGQKPYSYDYVGKPAGRGVHYHPAQHPIFVLMGGGPDVDEAFRWMISRAGIRPGTGGAS